MENNVEEEKHELAVLVELELYDEIRNIQVEGAPGRRLKLDAMLKFSEKYRDRFEKIPYDEYLRIISSILEKTENNIQKINRDEDDDRDL